MGRWDWSGAGKLRRSPSVGVDRHQDALVTVAGPQDGGFVGAVQFEQRSRGRSRRGRRSRRGSPAGIAGRTPRRPPPRTDRRRCGRRPAGAPGSRVLIVSPSVSIVSFRAWSKCRNGSAQRRACESQYGSTSTTARRFSAARTASWETGRRRTVPTAPPRPPGSLRPPTPGRASIRRPSRIGGVPASVSNREGRTASRRRRPAEPPGRRARPARPGRRAAGCRSRPG